MALEASAFNMLLLASQVLETEPTDPSSPPTTPDDDGDADYVDSPSGGGAGRRKRKSTRKPTTRTDTAAAIPTPPERAPEEAEDPASQSHERVVVIEELDARLATTAADDANENADPQLVDMIPASATEAQLQFSHMMAMIQPPQQQSHPYISVPAGDSTAPNAATTTAPPPYHALYAPVAQQLHLVAAATGYLGMPVAVGGMQMPPPPPPAMLQQQQQLQQLQEQQARGKRRGAPNMQHPYSMHPYRPLSPTSLGSPDLPRNKTKRNSSSSSSDEEWKDPNFIPTASNQTQFNHHPAYLHPGSKPRPGLAAAAAAALYSGHNNQYTTNIPLVQPNDDGRLPCIHPGCKRSFTRHFNLKAHLETHNPDRERGFKCDECGVAFCRQQDLLRHGTVHDKSGLLVCPACPTKTFSRKDALRRHVRINKCCDLEVLKNM